MPSVIMAYQQVYKSCILSPCTVSSYWFHFNVWYFVIIKRLKKNTNLFSNILTFGESVQKRTVAHSKIHNCYHMQWKILTDKKNQFRVVSFFKMLGKTYNILYTNLYYYLNLKLKTEKCSHLLFEINSPLLHAMHRRYSKTSIHNGFIYEMLQVEWSSYFKMSLSR